MRGMTQWFRKIWDEICRHKLAVGVAAAVLALFSVAVSFPVIWPKQAASPALEWLRFAAYLVGGGFLIWQLRISDRRATALEKGNITERFKSAIEHLGSASESVRMGGVYALYHVARESREYAETVCKILCAHAKAVTTSADYAGKEKPTTEITAILDVLFPTNGGGAFGELNIDISNWHLRGADVHSRIMMQIWGTQVNLSRANMWKVDLSGANVLGTNLSGASMNWANLSGADMLGANLSGANMLGANLSGASMTHVNLSGAIMEGANLSGASMLGANLSEARVTAEQLLEAKTLYGAQLDAHIREEILRRKPELLAPPAEEK